MRILSLFTRDENSWICKQRRSWSSSTLFSPSLWILNMIELGLNIFWKFADGNFVVCFLVIKEYISKCYVNRTAQNEWDNQCWDSYLADVSFEAILRQSLRYALVTATFLWWTYVGRMPGRVAQSVGQSVGHLTRKSGVLGSIPGLATYFRFSFRFFKKGSCQLLAKVCARSTG